MAASERAICASGPERNGAVMKEMAGVRAQQEREDRGVGAHPEQSSPRIWLWLLRAGFLLVAGALGWGLAGCGSGTRAFSGGGFPIGKSIVVGRAVSAENPTVVFAGVRIVLTALPGDGSSQRLETVTNAQGEFRLEDVPTGQTEGVVQLSAIPADPNVRAQSLSFRVTNGRKRGVFLSLPRVTFDVSRARFLTFANPSVALPPGDTVRISAQVRDQNGALLPVLPSLVYDADLGTIGGDGTFFGINEGSGNITAFWYNDLSAVATVRVDSSVPSRPPPPPISLEPVAP
ncbi:MAG: hypothetical protein RMJ43_00945 [Chloroherpetonaceae bacterium]|nr:hypothetical protein [Chthonomonadaceae bacterium]MDW8206375.1 hypothetical protein [Chloroherpetonaceae bacterium]